MVKDSVKCGNRYEVVSYPVLKGKTPNIKKINTHILNHIGNLWDLKGEDLKNQIKKQLNQLEKCCQYSGNCQIFDKGYDILYDKNNLVTIRFNYSTFRGKDYSDYISFNTQEGERINSNIIRKEKIGSLIKKINSKLDNVLIENEIKSLPPNGKFNMENIDNFFISTLNNKDGIIFQYTYGFEDEEYDPILSKKDLFFSFEELEPYLNKIIKQQIEK